MDMSKNKKIALGAAIALIAATFLPLISIPMLGSVSLLDALTEGGSVEGWLIPISALAAAYFVWSDNQKFAKIAFAVPYIMFLYNIVANSDGLQMIGADGIGAIFEVAGIAFYLYLVAPGVGIFFSKD